MGAIFSHRFIAVISGYAKRWNRYENLKKNTFLLRCGVVAEFLRSSLARRSVFSRWNHTRYKRGKRDGNLNKSTIHLLRKIAKPMLVKRKSPTPRGSERFGYMALCAVKATKSQ